MISGGPGKIDPRAVALNSREQATKRDGDESERQTEPLPRYAEYPGLPDDLDRISLTDYIDDLNRASFERFLTRSGPRATIRRTPTPS